ncbi:MAG: hypothetical protein ACPKPY_11635 [Nitrososphaeraceae archaeon]
MGIVNFALACSLDSSPGYFTYDNTDTMMIIQSRSSAVSNKNDFEHIEPFIESLISHESLHIVIKRLENEEISESLDDLEIIVNRNGKYYQVTINNMLFATDKCGLVM